jgi:acyl carrier protein
MKKINLEKIRALLCETFSNSEIPDCVTDLKIGDLVEWDSLGNFNLLLLTEEWFEVKFSMDDMSTIKSVSELISAIENFGN